MEVYSHSLMIFNYLLFSGGGQAVHLHEDGGTDQGHLENGETIKIEVPPNLQGDQLSQGQRVLL